MRKIKQTLKSIDRNRAAEKIRNGRDGQAYDALREISCIHSKLNCSTHRSEYSERNFLGTEVESPLLRLLRAIK